MKGKNFFLHLSALVPLILLFLKSERRDVLLFFGAVLIHEAGHLLALIYFRCRIRGFTLSFAGAGIETEDPYLSYKKEAWIFLSGPLTGMGGCLVAWMNLRWSFTKSGMLFFAFNLLLSLFNLLPVKGLDGGNALYALLSHYGDEDTAAKIAGIFHTLSLLLLFSAALWILKWEKNASLLLLTVVLALGTKRKKATITS